MAKKRKAKKKTQPVKNPTQIEAEKREAFFRKVKEIFKALDCPEAYVLLTEEEKNNIYIGRYHSVRLEAASDCKPQHGLMKTARQLLDLNFKEETAPLGPKNTEISYYDLVTVGTTLVHNISMLGLKNNPTAPLLKAKLEPLHEILYGEDNLLTFKMFSAPLSIGHFLSKVDDHYYWCSYSPGITETATPPIHETFNLHSQPAVVDHFEWKGSSRPAYKVGYSTVGQGIKWLSVTAGELGIESENKDKKYNVYIQKHAINRLYERLDPISISIDSCLFFSFQPVISIPRPHGGLLLEFHLEYQKKAGYLLADIVGDKLVIRTFLFLTNNSTPEGMKLNEMLGIEKADKEYLGIDKLNTFLNSDIRINEKVKQLFVDAGCSPLFEMDEIHYAKTPQKSVSMEMLKYLGMD